MIKMTRKLDELMKRLKDVSPETFFHAVKVKGYTYKLITKTNSDGLTNFNQDEIDAICKGALLHDVGKLYISNFILTKENTLTREERHSMRDHTDKGKDAIMPELNNDEKDIISQILLLHHDRIDGNGYHGVTEIPMYVQIVSICDAFEALCEDRVYRPAYSIEKALGIIKDNGCGVFDPKLVKCLEAISK